mmetsp:Transcript_4011/g.14976  ORF Transcript_4011/g.14976 Transcript_4011/m.14976 type:complete len:81 (-) Transcript_4011:23-265(-)
MNLVVSDTSTATEAWASRRAAALSRIRAVLLVVAPLVDAELAAVGADATCSDGLVCCAACRLHTLAPTKHERGRCRLVPA